MSRLTVVVSSPRIPAGLLSWQAWSLLHAVPVYLAGGSPLTEVLAAADIEATTLDPDDPATARLLVDEAATRDIAWVAGPSGDEDLLRRIGERLTGPSPDIELELLPGSWDSPGARLLDVVAVMDRLRSPGGCPWDAEQTHASLATYLIEEAYEAVDSIETGDDKGLREELGDVLLQVVFHARLAQEREDGWSIDDVAAGLVDKLIRRHPHVFSDTVASDAAEVHVNWEAIKAAERGGQSALAHVPMGQPALRLASVLQRKAARVGVEAGEIDPLTGATTAAGIAQALWDVVARAAALGVDAEAALREHAREFRDRVTAAESRRGDDTV